MNAAEWVAELKRKSQIESFKEQKGLVYDDHIEKVLYSGSVNGTLLVIEGNSCSGKTELLYHLASNVLLRSSQELVLIVSSEWDWSIKRLTFILHERLISSRGVSQTCKCNCAVKLENESTVHLQNAAREDGTDEDINSNSINDVSLSSGETMLQFPEHEEQHECNREMEQLYESASSTVYPCSFWEDAERKIDAQCAILWPMEFSGVVESIPQSTKDLLRIWKEAKIQMHEDFRCNKTEFNEACFDASSSRLGCILMDGLSTFYWQLRLERGYTQVYADLQNRLCTSSKLFGCPVVCTNWLLNNKQHLPIQCKRFRSERRANARFYLENCVSKLGETFYLSVKGVQTKTEMASPYSQQEMEKV